MLERFLEMSPILDTCDFSHETTLKIPETSERRKIAQLVKSLVKCKAASKFLQSHDADTVNMISVRNCFDDLIATFPEIGQNIALSSRQVFSRY